MIAAAVVCVMAVIGIAAYYFSGSSGKRQLAETAQAAMPAAVAPAAADRTAQVSVQPAAQDQQLHGSFLPLPDKKSAAATPKRRLRLLRRKSRRFPRQWHRRLRRCRYGQSDSG